MELHGITDQMALLIVSQFKGTAENFVDIMEVDNFSGSGRSWTDEASAACHSADRRDGQRMHDWIVSLLRTRVEMDAPDENVVIFNNHIACSLLRGASLAPEKKSQVLFKCVWVLDPDRLETVFPKTHEIERRTGQAVPPTSVARNRSRVSRTQDKCTRLRSSLNQSRTPLRRRTFLKWSSRSRRANLQKTLRKTMVSVKTLKCDVPPMQQSGLDGVLSDRRRISGRQEGSRSCRQTQMPLLLEAGELVLLEMTGHRDHRDDPRTRNSWYAPCGKLVTAVWTGCVKRRTQGHKSTTRKETVWIGTSTSRWEVVARDESNSGRRRLCNYNVSSLESESAEEEKKAWNQHVAFCLFSDTGDEFSVDVDFVHPRVEEDVLDSSQKEKSILFWHEAEGRSECHCSRYRHDVVDDVCVQRDRVCETRVVRPPPYEPSWEWTTSDRERRSEHGSYHAEGGVKLQTTM